MTRLTKFNLTAAMERKTLKKVEKAFDKFHCSIYDCYNEDADANESPSIRIEINDYGTAPAYVEIFVDIEKLSVEMDMPDLLEPKLENGCNLVEMIRKKYGELSNVLPFDKFYLSGLEYTSRINFPDGELAEEYIRLLKQSILTHNNNAVETEISPDGEDREMSRSYSYNLSPSYNITFYRLPGDILSDESTLVIKIWENNTHSIDQKLMSSSNYNKPIEEQLSFFIMTYMDYTMDKLSSRFPKSPYTKKDTMFKLILEAMDNGNIPQSYQLEMIEDIKKIPKDENVFTWLVDRCMLPDEETWVNLIRNRVQLACISDSIDSTDEFPDICTLVENGCYNLPA